MPTPYKSPLTWAEIDALRATALGNLKPYQLRQVMESLDRVVYKKGSEADMSVEPTISTILDTNLGGSVNP